jgi:hypothetical protein
MKRSLRVLVVTDDEQLAALYEADPNVTQCRVVGSLQAATHARDLAPDAIIVEHDAHSSRIVGLEALAEAAPNSALFVVEDDNLEYRERTKGARQAIRVPPEVPRSVVKQVVQRVCPAAEPGMVPVAALEL